MLLCMGVFSGCESVVIMHARGHEIPSLASASKIWCEFLRNIDTDLQYL